MTQSEIDGYNLQLNPPEGVPMKDAWRERHPDLEGHYSYYSVKFQCRTKGIGWRLDSFVVSSLRPLCFSVIFGKGRRDLTFARPDQVSEPLMSKVKQCEIRLEVWGASDHVPVILDIEGPL